MPPFSGMVRATDLNGSIHATRPHVSGKLKFGCDTQNRADSIVLQHQAALLAPAHEQGHAVEAALVQESRLAGKAR